ncbi:MAG: hypothetical protein ABSG46_15600, partial [Candidatus Binataceae bacterium]
AAYGITQESVEIIRAQVAIKDPSSLGLFVMPRNEAEYDAAAEYMDALVDEIGDHPEDPRNRLIETLAALISAYDDKHYPIPESSPIEVLRYLMTEHGLTQGDLPEIGSQGVVSEILGGRPS